MICRNKTHSQYIYIRGLNVRTKIVSDDTLLGAARKLGGHKTKKATIEHALILFIQIKGQKKIRTLKGKVKWEGDLDEMRRD